LIDRDSRAVMTGRRRGQFVQRNPRLDQSSSKAV
jgi:hypothetical protein